MAMAGTTARLGAPGAGTGVGFVRAWFAKLYWQVGPRTLREIVAATEEGV